jgi:RNA polymerase-binding transcription factor DksA
MMARKSTATRAPAKKARNQKPAGRVVAPRKPAGGKARATAGKTSAPAKRETRAPRPPAKAARKRPGPAGAAVAKAKRKAPGRAPKASARAATASKKSALKKAAKPAPRTAARAAEKGSREIGPSKTTEKISRAVKKLLALKAEKSKKVARREGYLIKAPKKTRPEERPGSIRFARRPNSVITDATVTKDNNTPNKPRKALRKKDVDDIKRALTEERQRLINHLSRLDEMASLSGPSDVNQDVPGYSIHMAEYASDNQIVETSLAQRALQAERLSELEQALQRINQPGYGVCQNCGANISIERLKIKPFAVHCTRCRELSEQGRL